jgi:hypothetical protein
VARLWHGLDGIARQLMVVVGAARITRVTLSGVEGLPKGDGADRFRKRDRHHVSKQRIDARGCVFLQRFDCVQVNA